MDQFVPKPPARKIEEEREPITVDQYDWYKVIEPGNIGETTGLGPCFGVIIYDPRTKSAIVAHFVAPWGTALEKVLEEAAARFKEIRKLKVYVGGNSLDLEDAQEPEESWEMRKFIEDKIKEKGIIIQKIQYQEPNQSTIMRIDTRTGKVEYDVMDHPELERPEDE